MENSFSPISFASPPVAAMLPAVSDASEVVSRFSVAPTLAISWPFLSTRKTILALASRARRSQTALICWNSSSYITICGCIRESSSVRYRPGDANRRSDFGLQLATPLQRARQSDLVGILQVASARHTLCDSAYTHPQRLHQAGEVEGGRLAFYRGVGSDDHFL